MEPRPIGNVEPQAARILPRHRQLIRRRDFHEHATVRVEQTDANLESLAVVQRFKFKSSNDVERRWLGRKARGQEIIEHPHDAQLPAFINMGIVSEYREFQSHSRTLYASCPSPFR